MDLYICRAAVGRGHSNSSGRNNSSGTSHRIQQSQTDQRQTEQNEFISFQSGFSQDSIERLKTSGLGPQPALVWPEKRSASHPPLCPQNANAVCRSRTAHQWIAEPMRFPAMGGTRAADARYGSSSGKETTSAVASQELAARAATRDQHLRSSAQLFVPEITSKIWVLTWQRPLKFNFLLYLKCDCRPGLAGRVLIARSFLD